METTQKPPNIYIPLSQLIPTEIWPEDLFSAFGSGEGGNLLDKLFHADYSYSDYGSRFELKLTLMILAELEIPLPFINGVSIVLGSSPDEAHTFVEAFLEWGDLSDQRPVFFEGDDELDEPISDDSTGNPDFRVQVDLQILSIRFSRELLKPVSIDRATREIIERDGNVEINIAGTVLVDSEGNIDFMLPGEAESPLAFNGPFMIGDSGVVIDVDGIVVRFSRDAALPEWVSEDQGVGVYIRNASVFLPPEMDVPLEEIRLERLIIAAGGFSGTIRGNWNPIFDEASRNYNGTGAGTLFGIPFGLRSLELTFNQNIPTASTIQGELALPFFDQPLGVDIAIGLEGSLSIALSAVQPAGVDYNSGLVTLKKPGILSLQVDSLGFEVQNGVFTAKLSGKLTPLFGDLDWPTVDVRELSIDSDGHVHLDGGWLDLRDQYSLDFYGFQFEITKLGFGKTEDGGKWIGFSGGLKLVDGLPAGASVEGLRITWYDDERDTEITFNGIGVEFEVPDVLHFQGAVSYDGEQKRFTGEIALELLALDLSLDGKMVFGTINGSTYFGIYLDLELPAGIPLWSTGLALYGGAGLFYLNGEPNKSDTQEWYKIGGENSYYHADPIGVTDIIRKWRPQEESLGLGAGVTIGTVYDNGFTFAGRFMFGIVFPGPIIFFEGAANLLKERSALSDSDDPNFRALAVLDGRAGTFTFGLVAQYKVGANGELIDIQGSVEAFFSFHDTSLWHLYLGEKEPREKRIRAQFFSIFESNSYFMLDAHQLATGAWVGWDVDWQFGPLRVILEAWIEGNAIISWKPVYFHGDLLLHARIELSVFGFGLGLWAEAIIEADVFNPFHLLAELCVGIILPWPLPDFEVNLPLEWGPEPTPPSLPLPLKEIAVEHFKVTTSWPLTRDHLLLPNYNDPDNEGFLHSPDTNPITIDASHPPDDVPVVPLDCRPHITFGRAVHDDAEVGHNPQPVLPNADPPGWEWIGDPEKNEGPVRVRFGLKGIALHKWSEADRQWKQVARKGSTGEADDGEIVPELFGSWAPIPQLPSGVLTPGTDPPIANVKLWLWSKNPFDYTRHNGRSWDEGFLERFRDYPCLPTPQEVCYDFETLAFQTSLASPWAHPNEPGLVISWENAQVAPMVTNLPRTIEERHGALCFPGAQEFNIVFPQPANLVKLIIIDATGVKVIPYTVDGTSLPEVHGGLERNPIVVVSHDDIARVVVRGSQRPCLIAICFRIGLDNAAIAQRQEMEQHLRDEMARWYQENNVLEPHTTYRLKVVTTVQTEEFDDSSFNIIREQTEYAYFRAEGPPGLTELSVPIGSSNPPIYNEGTVSVVSGFRNVRGHDTLWEDDKLAGAFFQLNDDPTLYIIERVVSPGELILTHNYAGSNSDRVGYVIFKFATGLDDLTLYVRQTIPATVPAPGEQPPLPKPVYRAYDLGVEFNESYVDLMYRMARRDLGLYLYNSNNQPVRDAEGRLIVLSNRWGETEDLTLTESDERFITLINNHDCAPVEEERIPHNKTLISAAEGQVLDADTVYEARLVPLLLHEDFTQDLTGWQPNNGTWEIRGHALIRGNEANSSGDVVQLDGFPDLSDLDPDFDVIILETDAARPSRLYRIVSFDDMAKTVTVDGEPTLSGGSSPWRIPTWGFAEQTSNYGTGSSDRNDPAKTGPLLLRANNSDLPNDHPEQPGNWTDYRFSVLLHTTSPGQNDIGAVIRYQDDRHYYRLSMSRAGRYRRLVRVFDGAHTILAEDDFTYQQDQDYLITIEAIGPSLRVYQEGVLVFDVTENLPDHFINNGSVGLYCWRNPNARFSDVRVDDFRAQAPIVYRFKFTTSKFTNFFHHLHSFQDEIWRMPLPSNVLGDEELSALLARAVAPDTLLSDDEARAYETLAEAVLKQGARQNPPEVQITRVERSPQGIAFLVQSPEPIDWKRITLEVLRADEQVRSLKLPDAVKLTDATFGIVPRDHTPPRPEDAPPQPNDESVSVLLREATDLTRHRIEYRLLPGPLAEPTGDPILFVDEFEDQAGLLFREDFGPNALDHYEPFDEGGRFSPSDWRVDGGHIVQTRNTYTPSSGPEQPGTMAVTGSASWTNLRISATMRSDYSRAFGIVFRYQDVHESLKNYYRFSMDRWLSTSSRRLIRKVNGQVTVLWEDEVPYNFGQSYDLVIESFGDRLVGYLDGILLFNVQDSSLTSGRVGFYTWLNSNAHFTALSVEELESNPVLWEPDFKNLSGLEQVDEVGAVQRPSRWETIDNLLVQTSNIGDASDGVNAYRPGTYIFGGNDDWRDTHVSVKLQFGTPTPGAIGVMFRITPVIGPGGELQGYQYYRFYMNPSRPPYLRLIKKVGNSRPESVWDSGHPSPGEWFPYFIGESHEVTLRAVGSELRGYVDGAAIFTVYDSDLKHGKVGFYCSSSLGARFEQVVVTDLTRRVGSWTIHDEGMTNAPSVWRVSNGALIQTSRIHSLLEPDRPGTCVINGDERWTDYRFTVTLRSDDLNGALGVLVRYVDDDNYYRLSVNTSQWLIVKKENGITTRLLPEQMGGFLPGEPFTLTVEAIGSRLVGYMNTSVLFDLPDSAHAAGRIGLYCWQNSGARFERVEVRRPSLEAYALLRDRFADGDRSSWIDIDARPEDNVTEGPSDWTIDAGTFHQRSNIYTLPNDRGEVLSKRGTHAIAGDTRWNDVIVTARLLSHDDDAIGLLFRYTDENNYYRFSMDSQRRYRRLVKNVDGNFTPQWEDDFAYEMGRVYELTIVAIGGVLRGYMDGVPMFIVEDDAPLTTGKIGLYCWGNNDARFSQVRVYPADKAFNDWLLDEPFDREIPGRWTKVDEGDQGGPSNWEMRDGEYQQTSDIFGTGPGTPGTYVLAGDRAWTDYRVSIGLRSDDEDAIGAVVRHQDSNNYYLFSMNHRRSYRRLIKKVAGRPRVLWEDPAHVQYNVGQEYVLTIDCVGQRLSGYLNGVPLFTIYDGDLAAGRIGLYCRHNTGARFSEVRVAEPVWANYYAFSHEERMPAGTRLRVFAGSERHVPEEQLGLVRRFIAAGDESGQLRFPVGGVDLRVVAPGSIEGHTRCFLPAFNSVGGIRVIRKADGTALFLLVPTTSPPGYALAAGQYRLKLTYRRDNQEADPNSQVFSEAGNNSEGKVKIDIPWG